MTTWIDAVGYLASALVLLTFCMGTMLNLRAIAICSNLAFIGYGLGAGIYPVLILHVILLPLNTMLLIQMAVLLRKAKLAAATDLSPIWLQPFMRAKHFTAGEMIFRKGDHADSLYLIVSGEVILPEIERRLLPGEIFGEIGLFSIERHRTASAMAATKLDSLWISGGDLKKLCERNPGLALYFLRLTATRMTENAARAMSPPSGTRSTQRFLNRNQSWATHVGILPLSRDPCEVQPRTGVLGTEKLQQACGHIF